MRLRALITASEGIAALERLVASAESEILLCLIHAQPDTPLTEPRLQERGLETWADLIAWTARRDVAVRIMMCEPDPVMAPLAHQKVWAQASGFANVVSRDAQVICAPHGQRAGPLWRALMPRRMGRAMAALRAMDSGQRTPVQRRILSRGPEVRAAQIQQSFAVADGRTAILGAFALEGASPPAVAAEPRMVLTDDGDLAAALRAHFVQTWSAALDAGAQSLAARAEAYDTRARAQTRPELRLLRTVSQPAPGGSRLLPEPEVTDLQKVLAKALAAARRFVFIETTMLRDAALIEALVDAAVLGPELQLILVMPERPMGFDVERDWEKAPAQGLQQRALDRLQRSFGVRMALGQPVGARICGTVVIVDDLIAVMGAFGVSPRSLYTDIGAAVAVRDAERVSGLMTRLGTRWTGCSDATKLRQAITWQEAARVTGAEQRIAVHAPPRRSPAALLPHRLPEAFF